MQIIMPHHTCSGVRIRLVMGDAIRLRIPIGVQQRRFRWQRRQRLLRLRRRRQLLRSGPHRQHQLLDPALLLAALLRAACSTRRAPNTFKESTANNMSTIRVPLNA